MKLKMALILIALNLPVLGAVINPDGSGDYPTIQSALADLPTESNITLGPGVFTGAGNWDLSFFGKHFNFYGATGDPADVIFDLSEGTGRDSHRAIVLDDLGEAGCYFRYITFRGGRAPGDNGGAVFAEGVWVDFVDCVFEDNQAALGGAIYGNQSEVYLTRCHFNLNFANQGGALFGAGTNSFNLYLCRCENNHANDRGGVVASADGSSGNISISNSICWQNSATLNAGIAYLAGETQGYFDYNTFVENFATIASSLYLNFIFYMDNNIIAWGNSSPVQGSGGGISVFCNDIFGNTGGDYLGPLTGYLGTDNNISQDPQFCGISDGNFALQSDSPCTHENSSCPDQIGALPVECGEQATILMHWDALKTLY
ncbi:hypothetical protein H8E52_12280 [bacterium]|nr:hypothetical protein [bacterium]